MHPPLSKEYLFQGFFEDNRKSVFQKNEKIFVTNVTRIRGCSNHLRNIVSVFERVYKCFVFIVVETVFIPSKHLERNRNRQSSNLHISEVDH